MGRKSTEIGGKGDKKYDLRHKEILVNMTSSAGSFYLLWYFY